MSVPSSSTAHRQSMKSPATGRKSWFSFARLKPQSPLTEDASLAPDPTGFTDLSPTSHNGDPTERLRPIQFSPNRIATLYVSPSERNLYLAAMAQLDQSPPLLPLWTDPAPALPQVRSEAPLPLEPPSRPMSSVYQSFNGAGANMWSKNRPYSPKLFPGGVPDPASPTGLFVRDEFRHYAAPKSANHALVALSAPGNMRFTGFPPSCLIALDTVWMEEWPLGVAKRSEGEEKLRLRDENDIVVWSIQLHGSVWKKKGSEELDTVRLMLAMFRVLGKFGWTLVESIQAGGSKKDSHDLLFTYSAETISMPPAFFALSIPLPDRLSLINPPLKSTPALISALRTAILSSSPKRLYQENNTIHAKPDTEIMSRSGSPTRRGKSKKQSEDWKGYDPRGIKLEGWVHEGVYRFWVDGMRRWGGGVIKGRIVENIHPMLVINIVNNFTSLHFQLAGSIPLLPFTKGRDVLIFQSLSSSGLTVHDSYDPKSTMSGVDGSFRVAGGGEMTQSTARQGYRGREARDPRTLQGRPDWAGTLISPLAATQAKAEPPRVPSPHRGPAAPSARSRLSSLTNILRRTPSNASRKSLDNASVRESPGHAQDGSGSGRNTPRQRNVLVKKSSVRRKSVPVLPSAYGQYAGFGPGTTQGQGAERHMKSTSDGNLGFGNPHTHTHYGMAGVGAGGINSSDGTLHDPPQAHGLGVTNKTGQDDRDSWSFVNVNPPGLAPPRRHSHFSGTSAEFDDGQSGRAPPIELRGDLHVAAAANGVKTHDRPRSMPGGVAGSRGLVPQNPVVAGGGRLRNAGYGHTPQQSYETAFTNPDEFESHDTALPAGQTALADAARGGDDGHRDRDLAQGKELGVGVRGSLNSVEIPSGTFVPLMMGTGAGDDNRSSVLTHPLKLGYPLPTPPDDGPPAVFPPTSPTSRNTNTSPARPHSPISHRAEDHKFTPPPQFHTLLSSPSSSSPSSRGPAVGGSPKRKVAGVVGAEDGPGRVESMHGSVGWSGSALSSVAKVGGGEHPDHVPTPRMSLIGHTTQPAAQPQQDRSGQAVGYGGSAQFSPLSSAASPLSSRTPPPPSKKEEGKRVWDDEKGGWVDSVIKSPGSSRTRVRVG